MKEIWDELARTPVKNPFGASMRFEPFAFLGGAEALQLRMQAIGVAIPHAVLSAVPYILTIVVIAAFAGKASYPAAMNTPYPRRSAAKRPISEAAVEPAYAQDAQTAKSQAHPHTG